MYRLTTLTGLLCLSLALPVGDAGAQQIQHVSYKSPAENTWAVLGLFPITGLIVALLPSSGIAQQQSLKEQLVGTWALVSSVNTRPDGTQSDTISNQR